MDGDGDKVDDETAKARGVMIRNLVASNWCVFLKWRFPAPSRSRSHISAARTSMM